MTTPPTPLQQERNSSPIRNTLVRCDSVFAGLTTKLKDAGIESIFMFLCYKTGEIYTAYRSFLLYPKNKDRNKDRNK